MNKLRVLDLFSGIGGFSFGLERTGGFETVAFCEIEPYCQRVLARHWPAVPIHPDVTTLRGADVGPVDVICGGFPCQDISYAGAGAGIDGDRSGLWREYARLIGEIRPRFVIVENVAALLGRGLDRVLGDLAALGYDAEWHCIPASAVGAPHIRDRIWIVGTLADAAWDVRGKSATGRAERERAGAGREPVAMADATGDGRFARRPSDATEGPQRRQSGGGGQRGDVANADGTRLAQRQSERGDARQKREAAQRNGFVPNADSVAPMGAAISRCERGEWLSEPSICRVAYGVPARVDRLRALGNAVVPQIPELIGRAILAVHAHPPLKQYAAS